MQYRVKKWFIGLLSIAIILSVMPVTAMAEVTPFPDGLSGGGRSADDPYLIEDAEQFRQLSEYVNAGNDCKDSFFKLTADVDLGGEGNQWVPIGSSSNKFRGTFDGGGHVVSGLYIDNLDDGHHVLGLFGEIAKEGAVKNLGVSGYLYTLNLFEVGGIAGINRGKITGCYSACTIDGGGGVGGIAGINYGTVSDCYNVGAIKNGSYVGGIVGENRYSGDSDAVVKNCYNVGPVNDKNGGGIAGRNRDSASSVTECYYLDDAATGVGTGDGIASKVEPKSQDDFKSLASELGAGWTDDPFLGRPVLNDNREPWPISGSGTEDEPFEIPDKATLENIRNYINKDSGHGKDEFFKLTKDIDLSGGVGNPWTPIGDSDNPFQGTFDGDGHTVSELYINDEAGEYLGLFGCVGEDGVVKNVVVGGSVTGKSCVGGIAGSCEGTVTNSRNTATVSGKRDVGGVVGKISSGAGGKVTVCCNTGTVTGNGGAGGVVGDGGYNSLITNCYNTGTVTGENNSVGGVVGETYNGSVSHCYNTGTVVNPSSTFTVKSVCGLIESSEVTDCYYLNTTPPDSSATPKTAEQFASGEVAYLLQNGQDVPEPQVWGQTVGRGTPELTDSPEKKVYQITGKVDDRESVVWYSNGKAILPAAKPSKEGYTFAGWSKKEGGSVDFTAGLTVSEDTTVYAVFTKTAVPADGTGTLSGNEPGGTPKTGDERHPILWLSLLILSLIGIAAIIERKKPIITSGRHARK